MSSTETTRTNWDEFMCSRRVSVLFHFFFLFFFFQLKSLFEIFTFVSEWSIKYQYLILASLILVACNRNSVIVVLVQYNKDWSINSIRILRVISWVFLILGLFVSSTSTSILLICSTICITQIVLCKRQPLCTG